MTSRLLLVAGGTGGHIWPAISFGKWVEKNKPATSVSYLCGSRPLELEIYLAAGIEPCILDVEGSPLSGRGFEKVRRTLDQISALRGAVNVLSSIRPDCTLLFGGYVSLPVLLACKMLRKPAAMHEQNAYAGKVTRLAARMGIEIFTGWRECIPLPSSKYTRIGVPVRDLVRIPQEEAWQRLGLPGNLPSGPKLLVFSGSLGSSSIKDLVTEVSVYNEFSGWTFIVPAVSEKIEKSGENVYLLPKVWDAGLLYSLADMTVVRGGGSTLTELSVLGIPSLVIPWREASDDHQYHNAVSFSSENRALIWDGNSTVQDFAKSLNRLYDILSDENKKEREKQYNNAGRISEDLWLALSSYF